MPAGDAPYFQTFQQCPVSGAPLFFYLPVAPSLFIGNGGAVVTDNPHHVEIKIANVGLDPQPDVVVAPLRFLDMRHTAFDKQGGKTGFHVVTQFGQGFADHPLRVAAGGVPFLPLVMLVIELLDKLPQFSGQGFGLGGGRRGEKSVAQVEQRRR